MADNGNSVLDGLYLLAKSLPNKKNQAKAYILEIIGQITSSATTAWADITGKPTTFPPDTHAHTEADITDLGPYVGEAPIDGTPYVRQDAGWEVAATGGYTDEEAQDAIGTILTDTATIDFTYTDATPTIEASVKAASITEAMQVLADNTTNNVSITKHGYVPKAPNNTTNFLRADATWATPSASLSTTTKKVWLPAAWFNPRTSSPVFAEQLANARFDAFTFTASATHNADFMWIVPYDWASGAITFTLWWANAGTNTGNVLWRVYANERAAGADLNDTASEVFGSDLIAAPATAGTLVKTISSINYTPTTAGNNLWLLAYRVGNDATDTCTSNSYFIGLEMSYTGQTT